MNTAKYKFSPSYVNKTFDLILIDSLLVSILQRRTIGPLLRDYYVIRCCLSGKGTVHRNAESYSISAGDCYVCLPGDVITESACGSEPWILFTLTLVGIKTEAMFKSVGVSRDTCVCPWEDNQALIRFAQSAVMNEVCYTPSTPPEKELLCISQAYALFSLLMKEYRRSAPSSPLESSRDRYINEAVYYMEHNCDKKLQVQDIASHVGLNCCYFQRIFHEHTGMTPWEYIIRLRVSRACDLFASPNATNESVANSLGWEPSVLYRNFKRIVGSTPSQYRRELQAKSNAASGAFALPNPGGSKS